MINPLDCFRRGGRRGSTRRPSLKIKRRSGTQGAVLGPLLSINRFPTFGSFFLIVRRLEM
jgi:hypothetical protein